MTLVKLKTAKEFAELERAGKIVHHDISDSGAWHAYGTVGNPSFVKAFWWKDFGAEFMVVDHPSPIDKKSFEAMRIFFEDQI